MHFDIHFASEVSESSQYIAIRFCILPTIVVIKKFLQDKKNASHASNSISFIEV